ncbi:ead/Ea22-like family protein [Streptomyces sp. NBC_01549]|uniref:hypothetical protein n=1 Tax=Streptomyces sp. NBC_01549 TaxID=2975874 RepID=UPI002259480B|nr:hypothetical protein [Streptomyces sp. NBC_01549]MCX4596149.1 ead/Ea22-like family protein [Streptomyces sp. NBC_01549]
MTTPADELRTAAQTLLDLAKAATPGPWRQHDTHLGQYGYTATVLSGEGNDTDLRAWLPSMSQKPWDETRNVWPDAAYIAAVHPGVGLALADLLQAVANDPDDETLNEPGSARHGGCDRTTCPAAATLAVARAINGTAS